MNNHQTTVERCNDGVHKYQIVCAKCGVIALQRSNLKVANERAEAHMANPWKRVRQARGNRAVVREINRNAHVNVASVLRRAPVVNRYEYAPVAQAPVVREAVENPQTKEEWITYIAQKGLQELGRGASRKVYALDETRVIKIEYAPFAGQSQCENEVRFYNSATEAQKKVLAHIHESGRGWEIMERARNIIGKMGMGHEACRMIRHDLQTITNVRDLHENNIGYFGAGMFKILDYGL
jgi:hypothetical protein